MQGRLHKEQVNPREGWKPYLFEGYEKNSSGVRDYSIQVKIHIISCKVGHKTKFIYFVSAIFLANSCIFSLKLPNSSFYG